MAIEQSDTPAGGESKVHGLVFGTLDTARKLLTRVEQHLGLPVSDKSTFAGTVEAMASEATRTLMVALRAVEAKLSEMEQAVVSPTTKAKPAPKAPPA